MAEVRLFRGLRYDDRRVDLGSVVCPPYDVISPAEAAAYRAGSQYNAIHLHMPAQAGGVDGSVRYLQAAAEFERWQREQVLVRDPVPGLYVVDQEFRGPDGKVRTRHGFIGRLRLEDFGTGVVRPHERTNPAPKRDRLSLLRATRANLSQVFMLYPDEQAAVWRELAAAERPLPPVSVTDHDGTTSVLQLATGPRAEQAAALLADRGLVIADGHHRYETALKYRDERSAVGDASAGWIAAYFCGMSDPGLAIFPAHRLLRGIDVPPLAEVKRRLAPTFSILAEWGDTLADLPAMLAQLAGHAPKPVFGLVLARERATLVVELRDAAAVRRLVGEGLSPVVAELPVTLLHHLLLRDVFGVPLDAGEAVIDYYHRPAEAFERLESAEYALGAFLNAPTLEDVHRVTSAGEVMPQKATYFFPKLLTGLVFNPLDDG